MVCEHDLPIKRSVRTKALEPHEFAEIVDLGLTLGFEALAKHLAAFARSEADAGVLLASSTH
mgnify:CR=1 FL=1